jgi:putative transposase
MDEDHLMVAARDVALNPVRARLAGRAQHWPRSDRAGHLDGRNDGSRRGRAALGRRRRSLRHLLDGKDDADKLAAIRAAEGVGRPLGSKTFLDRVAALTFRNPRPGKPGRKPKGSVAAQATGH